MGGVCHLDPLPAFFAQTCTPLKIMFASLNRSLLIMLTFCYIKICIIFTNADDPCPSDRDHMNKLESIIILCPSPPDVSSNSFGGQYIKHDPSLSISAN